MANLNSLGVDCGNQLPPGTLVTLYYTCTCELTGYPATVADGGGTAAGDTRKLDAAFDFSGAASGLGYWRSAKMLTDTGAIKALMEGEVGGQGWMSQIRGFIVGTEAEQAEFFECMTRYSGCLSFLLKQKESDFSVNIGTPDLPAVMESAEMDSGEKNGDRRGTAFAIKAPHMPYYYDDATHGIDTTPNP